MGFPKRRNEMKTGKCIIFCGVVLMILASCSLKAGSTPKTVTVTKEKAGQVIDLRPGDQVSITLEGNPTTGFMWETQPAVDQKILVQAGEPSFQADSKAVGAGGTITLTFQAVDPGQADVNLVYHRPWETNVPPVQTFKITVVVSR
jgi:inhibitor of cysteine peptidase